ncbi:class II fructose-1,6-bisphosphate aldolase [Oceanobacillus damuensis]|uniref:class II fructose-1,6-bisphosphate aldolase n=1 Tax=Oceanobacillus damuensis TaxID=937928 RepID=UPI00082965B6|nr:class II fructose-1,6-bisphosphate aldolase [Oceanobacillus damuensis]
MGFVSVKDMLNKALKGNYAVGHFDVHNLEWVQSVLEAAEELNSPVILGVTEEAIEYFGGFTVAKELVASLIKEKEITVPVALHLDHGSSVENCRSAIDAGFSSVMIDASKLPFDENVKTTKEVVDYAHKLGVTVEAELGNIGGKERDITSDDPVYANIDECKQLVALTNIDSLAPALGSAHGPYKGEPKVDFKKMKEISESIQIPLVLHGASGLYTEQIKQAILSGTAKINVNADNHLAFTKRVRQLLNEHEEMYNAAYYIREGRLAVKEMIKMKIRLFGSFGKA